MTEPVIIFEPNLSLNNKRIIEFGLAAHAKSCDVATNYQEFSFLLREEGKLLGGLVGEILFNEFRINLFWLHENVRGKQCGSKLLQTAEYYVKESGCRYITVTTHEFQAPEFYKKNGFKLQFIENFQGESKLKKYFFIKNLE